MFRKLRTRLIVSHALPLLVLALVLAPLVLYLLETRYSLENLLIELERQGDLILELVQTDESVWQSESSASALVERVGPFLNSRIMLLDGDGRLLSSSLESDMARTGLVIPADVVQEAIAGETSWQVGYNQFMQQRIVDVARPIMDENGAVIGILRFSHDISQIERPVVPLRLVVLAALVIGIAMAFILSFVLSRSLISPLSQLKQAVTALVPGSTQMKALPESGPDEVRTVAISYNDVVRRLQKIEQDRRQLLANIVHELGTPLGAIKAATQALQNGATADPDLSQDLISGMASNIDQLRLLIDDLALLGESEVRELTIHREWVDLNELVVAKCQEYRYLISEKQIELSYPSPTRAADTDELKVFADAARLGQILANLLQNAYRYTPAGGHIEVRVEIEQHTDQIPYACVSVQDSGPGIAPEEHEDIFQIRYRSPRQQRLQQGMGIGLALARRLAEAHSGQLVVESALGKGSTFTLRLPLAAQTELPLETTPGIKIPG